MSFLAERRQPAFTAMVASSLARDAWDTPCASASQCGYDAQRQRAF
jgi:hypothetical protein